MRIDENVDEALSRLAQEEGISINSVISRALQKHVDWDIYAQKFGFVSVPSTTFEKLVKSIPIETARELGKWTGRMVARDFIAFRFKKMDFDTALRALEMLGPKYGNGFEYEHESDGRAHTIIISHGIGPNASAYYEEAVWAIFNDLLQKRIQIDATSESQVVARIFI